MWNSPRDWNGHPAYADAGNVNYICTQLSGSYFTDAAFIPGVSYAAPNRSVTGFGHNIVTYGTLGGFMNMQGGQYLWHIFDTAAQIDVGVDGQ
jgi:hypothetical protein